MRTVVVGASSGLGRCIGVGLAKRGAQTALLARRLERLEAAAKEAGPGAIALACDVTDPESCATALAEAARQLGGIDALVYTPAIGPLASLTDIDVDTWRRVFDTNVIGAALVTTAALPHLAKSEGIAVYLSSGERIADTTLARIGLVRGQQGGARQARGGVPSGASQHRLHPLGRRGLRRRRG